MLQHCLYISESRSANPEAVLENIARVASARNAELGVTGVLFFSGGCFIQFLEGPPHAIDFLLERIERDRRHARFTLLLNQSTPHRIFAAWSMGVFNLDQRCDADANRLRELVEQLKAAEDAVALRSRVLVVLEEFRRGCLESGDAGVAGSARPGSDVVAAESRSDGFDHRAHALGLTAAAY